MNFQLEHSYLEVQALIENSLEIIANDAGMDKDYIN